MASTTKTQVKSGRQSEKGKQSKPAAKVNKPRVNVFHQRLGTLTYHQACRLPGEGGKNLIQSGWRLDIDCDRDVFLGGDLLRVRVADAALDAGVAVVTLTLHSGREKQLALNCDQCEAKCIHLGAALEFLLSSKTDLGLAMPPDESVPLENLTRMK